MTCMFALTRGTRYLLLCTSKTGGPDLRATEHYPLEFGLCMAQLLLGCIYYLSAGLHDLACVQMFRCTLALLPRLRDARKQLLPARCSSLTEIDAKEFESLRSDDKGELNDLLGLEASWK